jgi:hypothetical protein
MCVRRNAGALAGARSGGSPNSPRKSRLTNLLEDLRDAYTGTLEQTILTEVAANALDSGATRVRFLTKPG